jgi:hypothetical protein
MDWKSRGFYFIISILTIALIQGFSAIDWNISSEALPETTAAIEKVIPDPETIEKVGKIIIEVIIAIIALWKIITGKSIRKNK